MQTIEQFIDKYTIAITSTEVGSNPHMPERDMRHFKVKLAFVTNGQGRQMTVPFSMGWAHRGDPKLAVVLDCLADDAASVENADGFEDWAEEFGFDPDSRKAERLYKATKRQTDQLRSLLGDAYDELLWETERN